MTISGEELAVKVRDRLNEALQPRSVRVDVKLLNAPFELRARAE